MDHALEESAYRLVSSGSAALLLALKALKQESKRKQVVIPAYTCPSVLSAVLNADLQPVLCDLEPFRFRYDLDRLALVIGPDTLAVIAIHLYGLPERIREMVELADENGVYLVEDAAQTFCNQLTSAATPGPERCVGQYGDLGVWSFGRGKPFSLLNGGAVLVNNPDLLEPVGRVHRGYESSNTTAAGFKYRLNLFLYSFLFHPRLYWVPQSMPFLKLGETVFDPNIVEKKMSGTAIALGNRLMSRWTHISTCRRSLTKAYIEGLGRLKSQFAYFPNDPESCDCLLRFPIIFKNPAVRRRVLESLQKNGLGASGSYPVPLNEQDGVPDSIASTGPFPNAKMISERVMTLPLHDRVTLRDIRRMIDVFEMEFG